MATPINRIKIQEKDLTSAGFSAAATDVVYVPGFSAFNDQIVFSEPGISPFDKFKGLADGPDTSKTFINAADEISWKYDSKEGAWIETATYVEPHPENVPVLCETVQEFETMFGEQPFIFEAPVMYSDYGAEYTKDLYNELMPEGEIEVDETYEDKSVSIGQDAESNDIKYTVRTYTGKMPYALEGYKVDVESSFGEVEEETYDLDSLKAAGIVYVNEKLYNAEGTEVTVDNLTSLKFTEGKLCGILFKEDSTEYFIINPEESAKVSSIEIFNIFDIERDTVKPSNGFSAAATSISAMYKEDTPDLSYIYAKTLIKLGLPVIYENVSIRDNIFPLKDDVIISPDDDVIYSADGEHVVSINDEVQCTGEKNMSGIKMVENLYNAMVSDDECFSHLSDKGEFTVKYITSGGYPTFEYNTYINEETAGYNAIAMKMINIAAERGDSVAIIDHTNKPERPLSAFNSNSVFNALIGGNSGDGNYKITASPEFGTMFTPWALYSGLPISWEVNGVSQNAAVLPASFGYLVALAVSIRTNANWLAIAGATRGQVPYINSLNTLERLSNTIADSYQSRDDVSSLNAITNIKPYGLTIWGNRTLKDNAEKGNLTATSFLNLRNLVSDIKKTLYTTCKSLLFEQNNDILWVNFKMKVTPLLDKMQSGAGISGYKLIKGTTTEKAKLVATVKIYPIYAIEEFDVTVEISDQEVSVS